MIFSDCDGEWALSRGLSRSENPKYRMDRLNRIIEFFERFVEPPE